MSQTKKEFIEEYMKYLEKHGYTLEQREESKAWVAEHLDDNVRFTSNLSKKDAPITSYHYPSL